MPRRPSIDWLRGFAVLLMISWHSIDAWALPTGRDGRAFAVIIFFAGWAAPGFLFLAGVAIPLAGASRMKRGATREQASWMVQKRGWEVFLLAHLFRFQSFLLNPSGTWNSLLKPDILNILGLAIVLTAACWEHARSPRQFIWWFLAPSIAIVVLLTPLSRIWWWPTLLPPRFEAYIRPVGTMGVFTLFPETAYVLVGGYLGSWLVRPDVDDARLHRSIAWAGLALLAGGVVAAWTPSPFRTIWPDSISLFLSRTGTMTFALSAAWWMCRRWPATARDPLILFGRTSLFVYWVHVELAYGIFSYPLHHALPLPWAVAGFVFLTLLMWLAAYGWARRGRGPLVPAHMRAGVLTRETA